MPLAFYQVLLTSLESILKAKAEIYAIAFSTPFGSPASSSSKTPSSPSVSPAQSQPSVHLQMPLKKALSTIFAKIGDLLTILVPAVYLRVTCIGKISDSIPKEKLTEQELQTLPKLINDIQKALPGNVCYNIPELRQ
jgi:hypothetical protein